MNRRVVITGMGLITPLGQTLDEFWGNLREGKSGIDRISSFDPSEFSSQMSGEVKGFDPEKWIDARDVKRIDRFSHFAIAAANEAAKNAGLDLAGKDPYRYGAIMGSGIGGFYEIESTTRTLLDRGPKRISPFFIPKVMMNSCSAHVAMRFGLKGPNFVTASACASSNHAMACAYSTIKSNEADVIVTGGSEAAMTPLGLGGFCALKALSTRNDDPQKASRPFDKDRDGFVLSEGCGVLIFEELEHAKKRGATICGEVLGVGQSDDAHHITAPVEDGAGAAMAMQLALKNSGINTGEVSYINAHGTSTPYNDRSETRAIKTVFGDYAYKLPISSTKSMIGHLLGGAAAVELIATVLCIKNSIVHPTINYETPDPDCDLDYVPNAAREHTVNVAISNSFGFGGHNACLCVSKLRD
jgi:3-oxoacyl-[acyl-carrier-protein] synthase II